MRWPIQLFILLTYSTDWLPHVQLLLQQKRLRQAANELRRQLYLNPHEPIAHSLMALCLLDDKLRLLQAQEEAELAIHLAPEHSFAFYVLAQVQHRRHRPQEALAAINQALALDPANASYYHLLGQLCFENGQWQAALQNARTGLGFDSKHADLHVLEARALARQGWSYEASAAAHTALGLGADSSSIQAQAGYVALETNRSKDALDHFREALRLTPTSEFARAGLLEALKSHYWVCRTFINPIHWGDSLSVVLRRGLLLGACVVARFAPWLLPLYLTFAYLSWFKDPLFDLLLRLNRYGRYVLNPAQTLRSTHFLSLLGVGLAAGLGVLLGTPMPGLGTLALVALGLLFPLMSTEQLAGQPWWYGYVHWAGWALAAIGTLAVALAMLGIPSQLLTVFIYGMVMYIWVFALG